MAIPTNFDIESPNWMRNLRWVAIFGMLLVVLGSRFLLGVHVAMMASLLVLGAYFLWNVMLPWIENQFLPSSKGFVFLQVVVDLVALTAVLWFCGGLVNPFSTFFILPILMAGLLLNAPLTVVVSVIATLCVLLLLRAPSVEVAGTLLHLRDAPIWYGNPVSLILLIFVCNAFLLVFLNRLGRAQDQMRHRIKMDALGRLVAGLAHEIGTPLNSILVLSKEMQFGAPDEYKKDLSIIENQAKRCGEIVSLLLGYSQTFVRKSEDVKYSPVKLVPWIEETYQWLVDAESKKFPDRPRPNIRFEIKTQDIPEIVSVPTLILRQVLENLLKNARDALGNVHDPKITVHIYPDVEEDELVFVVEDNGPGFSREEKERAFEAFFSTKKQGFGSGLGLYISYYLLTQVGGKIVIDEHSGPGARMLIALPGVEGLDNQALQPA